MMTQKTEQQSICRVGPRGVRIAIWILSFTGFVLSSLAVASCRFVKVSSTTLSGSVSVSFAGIYNYQRSTGICVSYSLLASLPDTVDASSSIKAARAFGVLAALSGGIMSMWMLISIVFTGTSKPSWITIASLLTASTAFQLLTFLAFNDENCKDDPENETWTKCSIAEGSSYAISASIFYLLSSFGTFLVYPPQVPLVQFSDDWRGNEVNETSDKVANVGDTRPAHTAVMLHQEEIVRPGVSSTVPPPPMEQAPYTNNLMQAGASIPRPPEDDRSGTLSSTDPNGQDKFGVEL